MRGCIQLEERLNGAPCGIITVTSQGIITYANRTFLKMIKYELEEVENKHIGSFLTIATKFLFHTYFYPFIQLHGEVNEFYFTFESSEGAEIPILMNGRRHLLEGADIIDCVIVGMDKRINYEKEIREAKKVIEKAYMEKEEALAKLKKLHMEIEKKQKELIIVNEKLEKQATTDPLTSLKNRRYFLEKLDQNIALVQRTEIPFSLLILDIDNFKSVNDTMGHLAGDKILSEVADIIIFNIREIDIAARYGGEEFTIIFPHTNEQDAKRGAERLRSKIEQGSWTDFSITVSIGIATIDKHDTNTSIMAKADRALYASKSKGKNVVMHFSDITNTVC